MRLVVKHAVQETFLDRLALLESSSQNISTLSYLSGHSLGHTIRVGVISCIVFVNTTTILVMRFYNESKIVISSLSSKHSLQLIFRY